MSSSTRGPVLAYSQPAAPGAVRPSRGPELEALLAAYGLALARSTRPATGQTALRLVDRVTGVAPFHVPPQLARELAAWAAGEGSRALVQA
jgi:hypothetical protein